MFSVISGLFNNDLSPIVVTQDRLCSLVVRVPGYRSRDPGFDSERYQIF
jgi:hypothetical protein